MRIAIISDIHGNRAALQAALRVIDKSKVDKIICAGDIVDPMPQSREVLEFLIKEKIPCLRGNHEDYVVWAFEDPLHKMSTTIQYRPVKTTASSFDVKSIDLLRRLPMTLEIPSKRAGSLLVCHASPSSNVRGYRYGIDAELEKELLQLPYTAIVCGHWHDPETKIWNSKKLITAGSVGVPLELKHEPEFCILDDESGEWRAEHLKTVYDPTPTLETYVTSGWLKKSGPFGWILFHEVATARRTIVPFNKWVKEKNLEPQSETEWEVVAKDYLVEIGGWAVVRKYLG
jgi:putative phosphoesterase